jgi:xanthine dehydrogenase accessory factor
MGSVSGGCVEGAVVEEARAALLDGKPRVLTFGVSDDDAFAVGLACGGTIRVLVEPVGPAMPEDILEDLVAARAGRQAVAYVVDLQSWDRTLAPRGGTLEERFRQDKTGIDGQEFIAIHNPAPRLVVVGAVHIAQALLPMARACGHEPVLIDPRGAFGTEARFPGEMILDGWPDEALAEIGLDARTAVVTLTHDPKLDDPAIRAALASDVYYIGCLGSSRTHEKRLARLRAAGVGEDAIARIHAPVGIRIGAANPGEIALSVMAEVTQALRRGRWSSGRSRSGTPRARSSPILRPFRPASWARAGC